MQLWLELEAFPSLTVLAFSKRGKFRIIGALEALIPHPAPSEAVRFDLFNGMERYMLQT
jgi:hypothetical protein